MKPSLEPVSSRLFSVNSSPLTTKGRANINLHTNKYVFPTSAIVVKDLAEEAILGLDFLQKYRGNIDIPQRKLVLWYASSTPVLIDATSSNNRDVPLRAILCNTVIIPPFSELETLSRVDRFSSDADTWLIEDNLCSHKGITATVARAIANIVIRLINLTDSPVTVHKGTHIASISKLEGSVMSSQVSNSPGLSPEQLLRNITQSIPQLNRRNSTLFSYLLLMFSQIMRMILASLISQNIILTQAQPLPYVKLPGSFPNTSNKKHRSLLSKCSRRILFPPLRVLGLHP